MKYGTNMKMENKVERFILKKLKNTNYRVESVYYALSDQCTQTDMYFFNSLIR